MHAAGTLTCDSQDLGSVLGREVLFEDVWTSCTPGKKSAKRRPSPGLCDRVSIEHQVQSLRIHAQAWHASEVVSWAFSHH